MMMRPRRPIRVGDIFCAGMAPPAEGPVLSVEVAVTAPSQEQPEAATVVSKGVAQSVLSAAQLTAPNAGRIEEDMARGSPALTS